MRRPLPPKARGFARSLRAGATEAERRLWQVLRARRFGGLKFQRQVPLDRYIADFVCFEARLIVELDGSQHAESASDARRDAHFGAAGFHTLRIWNNDVFGNMDGVVLEIERVARERMR